MTPSILLVYGILLVTIALFVSERLRLDVVALLVGMMVLLIAVAASTAFATPVASPVNTLVLGPGGYRFGDFFKEGVALQLLVLAVTLVLVPVPFPF